MYRRRYDPHSVNLSHHVEISAFHHFGMFGLMNVTQIRSSYRSREVMLLGDDDRDVMSRSLSHETAAHLPADGYLSLATATTYRIMSSRPKRTET